MIQVKHLVLGDIYTNTYILKDEDTSQLAVVDPAVCTDALVSLIEELGGDLRYIFLTHGHFDHIGGVGALLEHFDAKVTLCEKELPLINDPELNGSAWNNLTVNQVNVDIALSDGDTIKLGDSELRFIHTPGHTMGSGCYVVDELMFSGDTLFYLSIGRTDFPTGDSSVMMSSLKRLADLDTDYVVLPGHSEMTKLSFEKKHNPYLS